MAYALRRKLLGDSHTDTANAAARAAIEDLTTAGPSYKSELEEAQAWLRERGG